MSKMTLTEEMPSSGNKAAHEHKWVKSGSHDKEHDVYICQHEGCSASKLVTKPRVEESKGEKPLLLG